MGKRDEINKRRGRRGGEEETGKREIRATREMPTAFGGHGKGVKMTSANFFPHESRCCSNPGGA